MLIAGHDPSSEANCSCVPIQDFLEELHARFATLNAGALASYIPELARADPSHFGIAIAAADGQVYEVGQSRQRFTIQSVSKRLVYGAALEDQGISRMLQAVGVQPSGESFNSISLEPGTGRPLNPMINSGAIAVASLIKDDTAESRLARVVDTLSAYAGRALDIDEAVFASKRDTGHRNRAIGHLLRNDGIASGDAEPALELYFKQCSLLVDCRDLALMAATLANGGAHPVTGQRAVAAKHISSRLSVMATCGIYDFTGEWVFRAGLPAKSGVGGGILAVLAGAAGHRRVFAAARRARQQRARRAGLASHLGRVRAALPAAAARGAGGGAGTLHAGPRALAPPAPARRNQAARRTRRCCPRVRAGGDLRFATIEPLLREIVTAGDTLQCPMLDFKRVAHVDAAATRLLARLIEGCAARGQQVVLSHVRRGELLSGLGAEIDPRRARAYSFHAQLDLGLEACERGLLARHGADTVPAPIAGLAQHRLCEGVAPEDVTYLQTQVQACSFDAGDTLVRRDDAADALFFILRGVVSVVVPLPQGGHKRLATLSAGMAFSETVLISGGRRSADVNADAPVEWLKLSAAAFAQPEHERPLLVVRLLHNLRLAGAETTARLTREVTALEG